LRISAPDQECDDAISSRASEGGVALAARVSSRGKLPIIGYLSRGSSDSDASTVAALWKGLSETGFVEGQNVAIERKPHPYGVAAI
jgi:hypothetical protein